MTSERLTVDGLERWNGESLVHYMHRISVHRGDLPPGTPYPDEGAGRGEDRQPGEDDE